MVLREVLQRNASLFRMYGGLRHSRPIRLYSSTSSESSSLPRIASPSLWSSMVPKPLRGSSKNLTSRIMGLFVGQWNPATFFIIISLLIGSNAIQMVSLKTRRLNYKRSTEAKLSLLREVIQRVQKGEDVDVEKLLGTGDPEQEKEWEAVLKDLEQDVATPVQPAGTTPTTGEGESSDTDRKPGFF